MRRPTLTALLVVPWTAMLAALALPASAHHADVSAVVRCDRADLLVSAWDGVPNTPDRPDANAGSRTNSGIAVALSVNGGPYDRLPQQEGWRFDAPGYAFATTVPVPDDARTVSVRVTVASSWANGTPPGGATRATPAVTVPNCGGTPVAVDDSGALPAENPVVAPRDATRTADRSGASPTSSTVAAPSAGSGIPPGGQSGTAVASSPVRGVLTWVAGGLLLAAAGRLLYNLAARRRASRVARLTLDGGRR